MLFSATFPAEVELLAKSALVDPQKIAMGISKPAITVTHALYPVPQHLKSGLLLQLLKQIDSDSVLIFTRTKHRADKLARQIAHAGHRVTSLHSNRTQGQREQALHGFKTGHFRIMVATDIAARGLDIESISHVINFDMPDTADAYIHRIGRTGRAQRTGDAFTLITDEDKDMIRQLERIMGGPIKREVLPDFDYTPPAPPRSGHERREGNRPPRPAITPSSYGKNRLAPRRRR
jgi:ATP-dependent RNA helicase RhlE